MSPLGRRGRIALWTLLGAGALIRLIFIAGTAGDPFDLQTVIVGLWGHLSESPFDVYAQDYGGTPAWIYPPGYFAWIGVAHVITQSTGAQFADVVRLGGAISDLAIALLVQHFLGRAGASTSTRLLAVGAVALGPAFILPSSMHGQVDAVAIVFAVAALVVWQHGALRLGRSGRAYPRDVVAGALCGASAGVKQSASVVAFGLLPTARTSRERITVLAATALVPLAILLPFFAIHPSDTVDSLRYVGYPGAGGLSLVLQPDLAVGWLTTGFAPGQFEASWSGLTRATQDVAPVVLALALLGTFVFVYRFRVQPAVAASMIWLTVYVFGFNFFVTYLVWGLPFFLMAGAVRTVVLVQVAWLVPLAFTYGPDLVGGTVSDGAVRGIYTPFMIAAWLGAVVSLVLIGRRVIRQAGVGPRESAEPAFGISR